MTIGLVIVASSVLILFSYHLHLFYRLHHNPLSTSIGLANHIRNLWVENIMQQGNAILAVQSLRNLTMAATFLASAAIIIGMGIVDLVLTTEAVPTIAHIHHLDEASNMALWLFKLLLLSVVFFSCFFNFLLSVRYYNHAVFLINVPKEQHAKDSLHQGGKLISMKSVEGKVSGSRIVSETVNRGAAHYTLGNRGYYLVIPLCLWLFGDLWFLIGSLLLIAVLHRIDNAGV